MKDHLGQSIILSGIGAYKPSKQLTNDDLAKMVDTSDDWIVSRTGIHKRHISAKDERASHMASKAALQAIKRADIEAKDIDLLVVATMTPDMPFPATACFVQHQLGLQGIPAFDIQAACSGFLYGLDVTSKMLQSKNYRHALIIGTEKLSSVLDWEDRRTCILFGDGAGAAVLSKTDKEDVGILDSILGANGSYAEILYQPGGGSTIPATVESVKQKQHFLKMNGPEVFKHAVKLAKNSINQILERSNLSLEDIAYIVPHQANIRIIESLSSKLKVSMGKFLTNIDQHGNTSAASIPLVLNDAYESNQIKSGDYFLMVAFGAGLTWAATLLKWH